MPPGKVHSGATEDRKLRTPWSKTFRLPSGQMQCCMYSRRVHYVSDSGELRSCDATLKQSGKRVYCEWLPYKFELHEHGIGFDFMSRDGGFARVKLVSLDGDANPNANASAPVVDGNRVTFRDVATGCDIVFYVLADRVKTLRIIRQANAPRQFVWLCEYDNEGKKSVGESIHGKDARGRRLDLTVSTQEIDSQSHHVIETWSGLVKQRDAITRVKSLSSDVDYPVEIDPTVSYDITSTANDITEYNTSYIYDYYLALGDNGIGLSRQLGMRFTGVAVPQGATINSATLTLNVTDINPGGYGASGGTLYGYDTNNAAAWSAGSISPGAVVKTTATAAIATPVATGLHNYDVTSIVQEIANRPGWSSGNALSLFALHDSVGVNGHETRFEDFQDAGTDEPTLSITYTSGGGGADTGSGAASFSVTASGVSAAEAVASGAGSFSVSGAAVGEADAIGSGAVSFSITASGAGIADVAGSGSATVSVAATGAAAADAIGSGAASASISATAASLADAAASGAASFSVTGAATGAADHAGSGAATFSITGSAVGAADAVGSGAASFSITAAGSSITDTEAVGSGSVVVTFAAAAIGMADIVASGASSVTFTAAGTGAADFTGSGVATVELTTAGVGAVDATGSGSASVTIDATATGLADVSGSGAVSVTFSADAVGMADVAGSGSVTITFTAESLRIVRGAGFTELGYATAGPISQSFAVAGCVASGSSRAGAVVQGWAVARPRRQGVATAGIDAQAVVRV